MSQFCILGEHCSVFDQDTGLAGLARIDPLCEGCHTKAERDIGLLRFDYMDLSQFIPRTAGLSDTKIARPKPASTPPIDVGIFTLREEIAYTLGLWDAALRQALRCTEPPPANVREGFAVNACCLFLMPRVQRLAGLPPVHAHHDGVEEPPCDADGVQALLRLHLLHERARRLCGIVLAPVALPGSCPSCRRPALRRDDSFRSVWCAWCRQRMSYEHYGRVTKLEITSLNPVTGTNDPR